MMRQDRFTEGASASGGAAICHSERRPRPVGGAAPAAKESGAGPSVSQNEDRPRDGCGRPEGRPYIG